MVKVHKETVKTIVIAVLVTGILAFIGGMRYQAHINGQVENKVKAISATFTSKP